MAVVLAEREIDLYAEWERGAGRTVMGAEGKYRIIHQGKRNGGPGPDYLDATIEFPDGSKRRGDVEIHSRGEDWHRHRHRWDTRYGEVILHVIAAGPLQPVAQNEWRAIPTIRLPRETIRIRSLCENLPLALQDFKGQDEFLYTLAAQRWWRRLADRNTRGKEAVLEALARRLGPDHHRLDLVRLWMIHLHANKDQFAFISDLLLEIPSEDIGRIRKELRGRVVLLSALAFTYYRKPSQLLGWSLGDIRNLKHSLERGEFPTPTWPFTIEVVGNWLFPLIQSEGLSDRFEEWYRLPLGWTYAQVGRHIERLGLHAPMTFGQQQGLLEWIESLCQPLECDYCPVVETTDEL
ncbi:MAG: DUF2851 family protein [Fidelibacterota bacterium]|nr:MAG: DUF2851 family protein [Candidatus Neomarinimicrobiota bacterium]